jgi:hypothetical protein
VVAVLALLGTGAAPAAFAGWRVGWPGARCSPEELARRREELSAAWDDKVKAYNDALDTLPDRVTGCLTELGEGG